MQMPCDMPIKILRHFLLSQPTARYTLHTRCARVNWLAGAVSTPLFFELYSSFSIPSFPFRGAQIGDVGVSAAVGNQVSYDANENGNKKEQGTIILIRVDLTLTRGGLVDTLSFGCEVLPARARTQGDIENVWLGQAGSLKKTKRRRDDERWESSGNIPACGVVDEVEDSSSTPQSSRAACRTQLCLPRS